MAEYTLYCFAESGNAYKAALMLELTRQDWARGGSTISTARRARPNIAARSMSKAKCRCSSMAA